jgi:hypothetical protein
MSTTASCLNLAGRARPLATLVAAAMLAACGGGGDEPAPAPASTNVHAAYAGFVGAAHAYSLTGSTSTGVALTASLAVAPGASAAYGSTTVDTARLTLTVSQGGNVISSDVSTFWQDVGTPDWAVLFSSAADVCALRTGSTALPTTGSLGAHGAYITGTIYPGCDASNLPQSSSVSVGTLTQTWSYQEIGGVAFVCVNDDQAVNGVVPHATTSYCAEVTDANGTLGTRVHISATDFNGVTTTLAN